MKAAEAGYRLMPVEEIWESADNPRRHWDPDALEELAASMRTRGVLVPLLVRPVNGHHELIDGARRLRAAKLAELVEVPVIVQHLVEGDALETAMVANLQRADVHPLDEAAGYRTLMALDPAYTPEAIAAKVGKSTSYVHQRLTLTALVPDVQQAWIEDRLTAGHAAAIAKLPAEIQPNALAACFRTLWNEIQPNDPKNLISLRELKEWIAENTKLDIRAPETAELFPEVAALVEEAAVSDAPPLLEVTTDHGAPKALTKGLGVLPPSKYREIQEGTKRDRCDHVRQAIVVHGYEPGRVISVCAHRKCAKHFPPAPKREAYDYKAENERRAAEAEAWRKIRVLALQAVVAATRGLKLTDAMLADLVVPQNAVPEMAGVMGPLGPITLKNLAQAIAVADALNCAWTRDNFTPIAKKYRIDLDALARKVAAAAAAPSQDTPQKGSGDRALTPARARRPVSGARPTKKTVAPAQKKSAKKVDKKR